MSDKTHIQWTDATWNPVTGCSKVSQGCKHCYAERDWARLSAPRPVANIYTGRAFTDVRCHPDRLSQPLHWRKPRRIFVNSMSDLFHAAVPDEFIDQVFVAMAMAPQHQYQVLTKRPDRMLRYFCESGPQRLLAWHREHVGRVGRGETALPLARVCARSEADPRQAFALPLPHVWLGVSVEDQATADERIPLLLQTPAAVRWVSAEPLLGALNLRLMRAAPLWAGEGHGAIVHSSDRYGLHWVVIGGESGPRARPMHPEWVRSLRGQCQQAGVPFFFKQWGEWMTAEDWYADHPVSLPLTCWTGASWTDDGRCRGDWVARVGKRAAGRILDGRTWDEYPE